MMAENQDLSCLGQTRMTYISSILPRSNKEKLSTIVIKISISSNLIRVGGRCRRFKRCQLLCLYNNEWMFTRSKYTRQTLRTISNFSSGWALPSFPNVFIAIPIPAQLTTVFKPPHFCFAYSTAFRTWLSSVTWNHNCILSIYYFPRDVSLIQGYATYWNLIWLVDIDEKPNYRASGKALEQGKTIRQKIPICVLSNDGQERFR